MGLRSRRLPKPRRATGPAEDDRELAAAASPWTSWSKRFRVDPSETRRDEIARLEALGVVMTELAAGSTSSLLGAFVEMFVDATDVGVLRSYLEGRDDDAPPIEFSRWMRADARQRADALGCSRWLAAGSDRARCVRFERRAGLPALEIELATLDDAWAASWPGLFVNFDAGRAVAISLDYEEVRCDVRAGRGTPYR